MGSVINFELLQRQEELLKEMVELQEEIDILRLLLKKVQSEYYEIDNKIKKNQQLERVKVVGMH